MQYEVHLRQYQSHNCLAIAKGQLRLIMRVQVKRLSD